MLTLVCDAGGAGAVCADFEECSPVVVFCNDSLLGSGSICSFIEQHRVSSQKNTQCKPLWKQQYQYQ